MAKDKDIERVTDLESVRRRPGMYFNLESPLVANCMAREAYCLAIDQIAAGNCTQLTSEFCANGFATVTHNGEPLGVDAETGMHGSSAMLFVAERLAFCAEHAARDYVSTHVCKNGMTALNACCERFEFNNFHENIHYRLTYENGKRLTDVEDLGECTNSGVMIRFKPDATIIPVIEFDVAELKRWFATIPVDQSSVDIEWQDNREILM